MNKTKIEWTDFSWNPVTGCQHGCPYCYARDMAEQLNDYHNVGFNPHFWPERLNQPMTRKKPAKIFAVSMGDLFGDWVPVDWWKEVFQIVRQCPQHTFQFLTKNPKRLKELNPWPGNCWVGATATDQKMFDAAVSHLREVQARVRFISLEPFLSPIRMNGDAGIQWLIVGALTGKKKRQPEKIWTESLIADAKKRGIAIFTKDNLRGYELREWPSQGCGAKKLNKFI